MSENFLSFAMKASEAERKKYWPNAQGLWESAREYAKNPENKRWTEARAEFCSRYARISTQTAEKDKI